MRNTSLQHSHEDSALELHPQNDVESRPSTPPGNSNIASIEDIPPDGGYGWICTLCVFLINAHTWGINSSWGIFLDHFLSHQTFPSATKFQYALIGGLSISQALLISPLVSITHKRFSAHFNLILGSLLIFVALFTASYATATWHLFLTQGVAFGWGMGFVYVTASALLPEWFGRRRSLAVGIATSGAGMGGLVYNLVAGKLVRVMGWRTTYRVLAGCAVLVNLMAGLSLKERNKKGGAEERRLAEGQKRKRVFNLRDFGRVEVLLVVFWGFVTELGYIALLYSLPNYATSIGLSPAQGSVVGALLNLGLGVGRPVVGYFSDRFGRINVAMGGTLLCGVLCLAIWIPAHSYAVLIVFALTAGTVCGIFWSTIVPVLAEVVGLKDFGTMFGAILFALVVPTTFAEGVAILLVKGSGIGAYLTSQIFVGIMFIIGAASLWILRAWKIGEVERMMESEQLNDVSQRTEKDWLTSKRLFVRKRV